MADYKFSNNMKLLYTLLILLMANEVNAQDICKQIKKEVAENKQQWDYSTPVKGEEMPMISIKRSVSIDEDYPFDNYVVVFKVICQLDDIYTLSGDTSRTEKQEKKMVIEFDDNTKITDEEIEILHDYTQDRAEAIRYVFYTVPTESLNDIASKKITKFTLATQEVAVPPALSATMQQYAKCIKEAKHEGK
jgi:hypothetical protein